MRKTIILLSILCAGLAFAQEAEAPLPLPAPETLPETAVPAADSPPLPRPRPEFEAEAPAPETSPAEAEETVPPSAPAAGVDVVPEAEPAPEAAEPIPELPPRIYQVACPAVLAGTVTAEILPPIVDNICVVQSPYAVTALLVNGRSVPLSEPATLNCEMATEIADWAADVDAYAMSRESTQISEILSGTSQFCRNVNNADAGRVSEHGFANALDVVGFALEDGRRITVEEGWGDAMSPEGRLLRFAHGAACTSFTTVLGPEANALHEDHLHLDLGCHGRACTARLCE